ncbi:MAG: hypothetical protein V4773_30725 [Verrucomicrobiota bacterium]
MRRVAKIKSLPTRVPLRKTAMSSSSAARRNFPAWIDAADYSVPSPATIVMPRVRDGLVLRAVPTKRNHKTEDSSDARGAR